MRSRTRPSASSDLAASVRPASAGGATASRRVRPTADGEDRPAQTAGEVSTREAGAGWGAVEGSAPKLGLELSCVH